MEKMNAFARALASNFNMTTRATPVHLCRTRAMLAVVHLSRIVPQYSEGTATRSAAQEAHETPAARNRRGPLRGSPGSEGTATRSSGSPRNAGSPQQGAGCFEVDLDAVQLAAVHEVLSQLWHTVGFSHCLLTQRCQGWSQHYVPSF